MQIDHAGRKCSKNAVEMQVERQVGNAAEMQVGNAVGNAGRKCR